jgi:hypothetical protein
MSHTITLALYIGIIVVTTVLGFVSQKMVTNDNGETTSLFRKTPFCAAILVAWLFIAFTKIGVDYNNYYYIIRQESWSTFTSIWSVESGFGLLCVVIKQIVGGNADQVIFILKTLTILFTFLAIYSVRNKIIVGYAVFAYMTLAYLPSFYLLSLAIAMSVVFMAMAYFMNRHKYIIPIILLIIAGQLHNAVYIFIPVFLALYFLERSKRASNLVKTLLFISYIAVGFFSGQIYSIAQRSIAGFHYNNYATNTFSGSGIMIIILYAPLAFLIYMMLKYDLTESQKNRIFIFSLSSLLFNVLSYRFIVIERMEFLLLSLYVLFIPEVLYSSGIIKHGVKVRYKSFTWIVFALYMLFRAYLVFSERTTMVSGMGEYEFFFPF